MGDMTPAQLAAMRARTLVVSGSGYGFGKDALWQDPATGMYFEPMIQRNPETELGDLVGFYASQRLLTDWQQGTRTFAYDLDGKFVANWEVDDPNQRDWGEMLALGLIAAMTGGAALSAAGVIGAGAGTASTGMVNGAFLGEATWTATAGEALSFGGTAAAAATTTAAAAGTAGAGATAAGAGLSLTGIVGTVGQVLGIVGSALGIAQQAGGSNAGTALPLVQSGTVPVNAPSTILPGVDDVVVWGVVGVGAILLFSKG